MDKGKGFEMIIAIALFIVIFAFGYVVGMSSHNNSSSKSTYFTGQVEGIWNNSPSNIQFTDGWKAYGNLANVKNLSINSICTLLMNESGWDSYDNFVNGTCRGN
jgi:hypothetical protein